jgi:hypothetical protein
MTKEAILESNQSEEVSAQLEEGDNLLLEA